MYPLIIGHRGTTGCPENTAASLMAALDLGAHGVEFDIVFSRDGVPFVCHDLDISDRVPHSQRPADIGRMSAEQVANLRIHGDHPVPPLGGMLEQLSRLRPARVYVHYKKENESRETQGHIVSVRRAIGASGMDGVAVVMVESGNTVPWRVLS